MRAKTAEPKQVLVLQKTLDILESIKKQGSGVGLAEIARSVSMPKATVYRILATLEIRGYLDRQAESGYRISSKLFALQPDSSSIQKLLRVAQPLLEDLARECGETVNLGIVDGGEVVVVATAESPQSIRLASKVGNRRFVHTTAIGKALLASMTDEAIRRHVQLKGLPRLTPNTITTQAALTSEINRIRKQKYAVDDQGNEIDGRCIGMSIPGLSDPPAALSISGPVFRMDLRRLRSLVRLLKKFRESITTAMAH